MEWNHAQLINTLRQPDMRTCYIPRDIIYSCVCVYVFNKPKYLAFTEYNGTFVYVFVNWDVMFIRVNDRFIKTKYTKIHTVNFMQYVNGKIYMELNDIKSLLCLSLDAEKKTCELEYCVKLIPHDNDSGVRYILRITPNEVLIIRGLTGDIDGRCEAYNVNDDKTYYSLIEDMGPIPRGLTRWDGHSYGVHCVDTHELLLTNAEKRPIPVPKAEYVDSIICSKGILHHLRTDGTIINEGVVTPPVPLLDLSTTTCTIHGMP